MLGLRGAVLLVWVGRLVVAGAVDDNLFWSWSVLGESESWGLLVVCVGCLEGGFCSCSVYLFIHI